jgi:hypothetical protein
MNGEQIAIIIVNILSFPFFIDGIIILMIILSFLLGLAKRDGIRCGVLFL